MGSLRRSGALVVVGAMIGTMSMATPAAATTTGVGTEAAYRAAVTALSSDDTGSHTIVLTSDITFATLGDPTYSGTQPLTIDGDGYTLDVAYAGRALEATGLAVQVTVKDVTILRGRGNIAVEATDHGGAIYIHNGDLEIIDSTIAESDVANGSAACGGGAAYADNITIIDSVITGNNACSFNGAGGGVWGKSSVSITNSTLSGNTAGVVGGAVFSEEVTAVNSTITGNFATFYGGGISASAELPAEGTVTLTHATVVSNTAAEGANLHAASLNSGWSVIAGPQTGYNCSLATTSSFGFNYADDESCTLAGTGDVENGADPMLGGLDDNGGPTSTIEPLPGSPLIDMDPTCVAGLTTDQRGLPRPSGPGCDAGAVEVAAKGSVAIEVHYGDSGTIGVPFVEVWLNNSGLGESHYVCTDADGMATVEVTAADGWIAATGRAAGDPEGGPCANADFREKLGAGNHLLMMSYDGNTGGSSWDTFEVTDGGTTDITFRPLIVTDTGGFPLWEDVCAGLYVTQKGTDGDDFIKGTEGDDVINAGKGHDIVLGLGGNDVICGGGKSDYLVGGDGDDYLIGGFGRDFLIGGDGNDWLIGGRYADIMDGGTGADTFIGQMGVDRAMISTSDGDTCIQQNTGPDPSVGTTRKCFDLDKASDLSDPAVPGRPAVDASVGGRADTHTLTVEVYYGAAGTVGVPYASVLVRTTFPAEVHFTCTDAAGHASVEVPDSLDPTWIDVGAAGFLPFEAGGCANSDFRERVGSGNHLMRVSDAIDYVDDDMTVTYRPEVITDDGSAPDWEDVCAGRNVTIKGTDGDDIIIGTDGNDVINAGKGHDVVYGLGGLDTICGGGKSDFIVGGDGKDLLIGGFGRDFLIGEAGDDWLVGGLYADIMDGGEGADTYNGQWGADRALVVSSDGDECVKKNSNPDPWIGTTQKCLKAG